MSVTNVKGAATAYQGSGQEVSTVQKQEVSYESKAPVVQDEISKGDSQKVSTKREEIGNDALRRAVEELNKKSVNSEAVFGVHEDTNRVTIKIVDKQSREIIREYPPEETLDMIAKVWELAGIMVDTKG